MASAVAGYRTSLGADGPPLCYRHRPERCLVVLGSNMAEAFPVTSTGQGHRKAKSRRRTDLGPIPGGRTPQIKLRSRTIAPAAISATERSRPAPARTPRPSNKTSWRAHRGLGAYRDFLCTRTGRVVSAAGRHRSPHRALADRVAAFSRSWMTFYCRGGIRHSACGRKQTASSKPPYPDRSDRKPGEGQFSLTGQPNEWGARGFWV